MEISRLSNGKFKNVGMREGFIILDINNVAVSSSKDVDKIYNSIISSNEQDKVMFITGIYPSGKKVYYAVDLND